MESKFRTLLALSPLILQCAFCIRFSRENSFVDDTIQHSSRLKVPRPTSSGYLPVNKAMNSDMFYAYYEAREAAGNISKTPIVLWLQGGPGCSSLFGMLYINGPYFVNEDDLTLRENPGSWNRLYGMLFIEQPIGTGFSRVGQLRIPTNELEVARDLFQGLQSFYRAFPDFLDRPLIITGESYAGKYVPSISHYILQLDAITRGYSHKINHPRDIPDNEVEAPVFKLGGLAIGNGFTDAQSQTMVQADVAWALGLIDASQKREAEVMQQEVLELVRNRDWQEARVRSDELNAFIVNASGTATLEDVRRNTGYDGSDLTTTFLNQPAVKKALGAPMDVPWVSCSADVDKKLAGDVMKSVRQLVVDLLDFKPTLLYQGQFDAECGAASNDAWIDTMSWHGHTAYSKAPRKLWYVNKRVAGFWKASEQLSVVVLRNTGHMVPHDNPMYGQLLIEKWVQENVMGESYTRDAEVNVRDEEEFYNEDEGPNANPDSWKRRSGEMTIGLSNTV
ncbi:hypothetical protein CEUSTIGMA_g4123.t1 [Chlamydomonas eustigma]|uniref:Carboxypeptidase n=1 Tax=Chlamydomonas eustigma TaxID=1157962 RepID=A0A250X0S6_9CHLO|nr:hypothetical protein CEUSTIGMA_g4123.t1 [Chlamydomonas eustigma]|eukprot:GAX76677.1 hypothetical protein CEUSTIGMA_g4123.t1 [Chlamydomonas eustigma]